MLSKYQQEETHSNKSQNKETNHSELFGKEKALMNSKNGISWKKFKYIRKEKSLNEFNSFGDKTLNKTSESIGHEKSNISKVNPLQEKKAKESNGKQETKPETHQVVKHSTKSDSLPKINVSKKFNNNKIALKFGKLIGTLNIADLQGLNKTKRIAFYNIAYNACDIARKGHDNIELQQRAENQQELSPTVPCPFCSPFLSKY